MLMFQFNVDVLNAGTYFLVDCLQSGLSIHTPNPPYADVVHVIINDQ